MMSTTARGQFSMSCKSPPIERPRGVVGAVQRKGGFPNLKSPDSNPSPYLGATSGILKPGDITIYNL